jgi:ABC-type phosphate/phosphonate transport system substrate-binding protein
MFGQRRWTLTMAVAIAGILAGLAAGGPASEKGVRGQTTIKIGLVQSLFRDIPDSMISVLHQPFSALMKKQTGFDGKLLVGGDALTVGQRLQEDQILLGVFHGFEFAWAQQKYPDLKPLVIAINHHRKLKAHLVARNDCGAADFADLKGEKLSVPKRTREHCHLYLQRHCREQGVEPEAFFSEIVVHPNVEEALDDVVRGKVKAALVDALSLECYEAVKPGVYSKLKVLLTSESFPAAVVAYRDQGPLTPAQLKQFRDGMINAHKNRESREQMMLWKLTAFEAIPADYHQQLADILRAYPPPGTLAAPAVPATSPKQR